MCSLAPGLILLREDWLHQLVTGSRTVNSSQINPEVRLVTRWRLRREVSTDASITYAHASLPKRTSPIYLPTHTHTHTHTQRDRDMLPHAYSHSGCRSKSGCTGTNGLLLDTSTIDVYSSSAGVQKVVVISPLICLCQFLEAVPHLQYHALLELQSG